MSWAISCIYDLVWRRDIHRWASCRYSHDLVFLLFIFCGCGSWHFWVMVNKRSHTCLAAMVVLAIWSAVTRCVSTTSYCCFNSSLVSIHALFRLTSKSINWQTRSLCLLETTDLPGHIVDTISDIILVPQCTFRSLYFGWNQGGECATTLLRIPVPSFD